MRVPTLVALLLCLTGAARADIHYQGQLAIIAATGNCDVWTGNGLTVNADFHPAFVPGGPPRKFKTSALNIYYNIIGLYGAHVIRLEKRNFPISPDGTFETPNPMSETNVDWFDYQPAFPANLIIMSQRLTTPEAGLPTLTLVGKIFDPAGSAEQNTCLVTFEFTGIQSQQ